MRSSGIVFHTEHDLLCLIFKIYEITVVIESYSMIPKLS